MTKDFPPNPFAGLRVAITGGTSGLGLALVRELLKRGAQVAFVARRREGVNRVVNSAIPYSSSGRRELRVKGEMHQ